MPDLDWVTDEQRRELDDLVAERGDWRVWLPEFMDEQWPDWTYAEPDARAGWLLEWMPTLLGQEADDYADAVEEEPAAESTVDVRELGWVTAEQGTRLTAVAGADWPAWLTGKLGELWPEWAESTPDVLVPWLDGWMPTLAAEPALSSAEAEVPMTPEAVERTLEDALREAVDRQEIDPEVLAILADEPELQEYFAAQITQHATQEVSS